ncbi:MAG: hypothetical protein WCO12_01455 [bacterium]
MTDGKSGLLFEQKYKGEILKIYARTKTDLLVLAKHKVAKKEGVNPEKIYPSTLISHKAFNSLVSRRDVRKMIKQKEVSEIGWHEGMTINDAVEMISPTQHKIAPNTRK